MLVYLDGDVLLYVLCDVMLGVVVFGDIGKYFFDIDDVYVGVDSCVLLCYVVNVVREKGYCLSNVDMIIVV